MTWVSPQLIRKVRQICLSLPEAVETADGEKVAFAVGDETFAVLEPKGTSPRVLIRVGPEDYSERGKASRLVRRKRVAGPDWVALGLGKDVDWNEMRDLVMVSYCSVAPKRMLKALDKALTA